MNTTDFKFSDFRHPKSKVSICAIVATHNASQYLRTLLSVLHAQSIDVVILDNESTDDTRFILREFRNGPVIDVITLPFKGYFSLTDQLRKKHEIIKQLPHQWVVHHDVDEIIEGRDGQSLRNLIESVNQTEHNVINFDEMVFLPDSDHPQKSNYLAFQRYYFFQPHENRLNRAYRRDSNLENLTMAGHKLKGENISIFPTNQTLRHYIVLNERHAREKYIRRIHDPMDIQKGWHKNRLNLTEDRLSIPESSPYLKKASTEYPQVLSRETPVKKHFWDW